ncbi:LysR family transcriptional regulator [Aerococcus mictus]|uniref:LysR family transcriptional regulator n=1 Tax=Aerococcus mictus TaxID=2976810 RepID=UPI000DCD13D8|nr:LysR family transcriptional regulator [Aerococcus mictus]KAA9233738.1 LysR family transcriptional regulator [Aerococcus mictus]MDL5183849.1 LysR family transcriptional regulator [Aerococcus mictus]
MNLYHLKYFVTLAKYEHYTLAAKELRITQPTLSNAIKSLETELGIQLFEKDGRNVKITRVGNNFLRHVTESLAILDLGITKAEKEGHGEGLVRLNLLRVLSNLVPHLARQFIDQNPEKNISFEFSNAHGLSGEMIKNVQNKKTDLAFCTKINVNDPSLSFVKIAEENIVLITSKDHPLAAKKAVDIFETLAYPQIWFSQRAGMRTIIDKITKDLNIRDSIGIALEVDEDETVAGLVAEGFGIAYIANNKVLNNYPLAILPIKNFDYKRSYYMVYRNDIYHAPVVEDFITYIKEVSL